MARSQLLLNCMRSYLTHLQNALDPFRHDICQNFYTSHFSTNMKILEGLLIERSHPNSCMARSQLLLGCMQRSKAFFDALAKLKFDSAWIFYTFVGRIQQSVSKMQNLNKKLKFCKCAFFDALAKLKLDSTWICSTFFFHFILLQIGCTQYHYFFESKFDTHSFFQLNFLI